MKMVSFLLSWFLMMVFVVGGLVGASSGNMNSRIESSTLALSDLRTSEFRLYLMNQEGELWYFDVSGGDLEIVDFGFHDDGDLLLIGRFQKYLNLDGEEQWSNEVSTFFITKISLEGTAKWTFQFDEDEFQRALFYSGNQCFGSMMVYGASMGHFRLGEIDLYFDGWTRFVVKLSNKGKIQKVILIEELSETFGVVLMTETSGDSDDEGGAGDPIPAPFMGEGRQRLMTETSGDSDDEGSGGDPVPAPLIGDGDHAQSPDGFND